jgi:hypothetical protein
MGADHLRMVEITGTEDSTPMRQRAIGFRDVIEAIRALKLWSPSPETF